MGTRKALENTIHVFFNLLKIRWLYSREVILFGSHAKVNPKNESDIDLAVWDAKLHGIKSIDLLPILPLLRKYPKLDLHFFHPTIFGPFEEEVLRTGFAYKVEKC
ncbi:MAG: hypothetical protein ACKVOU_03545 [Cytophagales bacterium]